METGKLTARKFLLSKYTLYIISFIIIGIITFYAFIKTNSSIVWTSDGLTEWYPYLAGVKNWVNNIISGSGLEQWSWSIGPGADFIGTMSSLIVDPFNYIVLLFPVESIDLGITIAATVRIFFAGFFMMLFLNYQKISEIKTAAGGLLYAFCGFSLIVMRHPGFLTAMLLFPLIMLGIDKYDRERRSLLLIVSIAFAFGISPYFAYMSIIFCAIYVIVKNLYNCDKNAKKFFSNVGYMILQLISGILISSAVLFPTIWLLLQSSTESGVEISFFHSLKQYLFFIPNLVDGGQYFGNESVTLVAGILIASIPLFFIDFRKKDSRKKIPLIILLICVIFALFKILCSIMNGFSYATARWFYILIFYYIWSSLASIEYAAEKNTDRKKYRLGIIIEMLVLLVNIGIISIGGFFDQTNTVLSIINTVFIILSAIFIYMILSKGTGIKLIEYLLLVSVIINLALNGFFITHPDFGNRVGIFMRNGETYENYYKMSGLAELEIDDEDFYRLDVIDHISRDGNSYTKSPHVLCNDAIFYNTPTIYGYVSQLDNDYRKFCESVSDNNGYLLRTFVFDADKRTRLGFLLNVQYLLSRDPDSRYAGYGFSEYGSNNGMLLLKNQFDTSIGYVYDHVISESDFLQYSYLDREQIMMQCAVVDDEYKGNTDFIDKDEILVETKDITYDIICNGNIVLENNHIIVKEKGASLTVSSEKTERSEIFVLFTNLKRKPVTYEEQKNRSLDEDSPFLDKLKFIVNTTPYTSYGNFDIRIKNKDVNKKIANYDGQSNQSVRGVEDYLTNLGYYDEFEDSITIQFNTVGEYTYDDLRVYAVGIDSYVRQAEKLEKTRLVITERGKDYLSGTVDSEGGLLYLSILDSGGWNIYIDGVETNQIYKTNTGFIGVDITSGHHLVELRYKSVGLKYGIYFSITGVLLALAIFCINKKKKIQ